MVVLVTYSSPTGRVSRRRGRIVQPLRNVLHLQDTRLIRIQPGWRDRSRVYAHSLLLDPVVWTGMLPLSAVDCCTVRSAELGAAHFIRNSLVIDGRSTVGMWMSAAKQIASESCCR